MTEFKVPNTFVAGTKAKAEEVDQNFEAIEQEINENLRPGAFAVGDLKASALAAAPTGWLLCEGQEVSRATYSDLFAAIGTTYGKGDSATTFNLPDLRGRVPMGADRAAGRINSVPDELGQSGGEEKHTLSESEMPSHLHSLSPSESSSGVSTAGAHSHNMGLFTDLRHEGEGFQYSVVHEGGSDRTSTDGGHFHDLSGSTAPRGGSGSHNNMQPYQVVNYLIKH